MTLSLDYLRRDNPRLLQLEADYAALNLPFGHTQWKDHQNIGVDIASFRAEGAYLGQGGLDHEAQYRTMYEYIRTIDTQRYLDRLTEDNAFGVLTYHMGGKIISRDLCDSIMELYFVQEALQGGVPARWLDIGAGYGRLAYRLNALFPQMTYITCVDAVPVSTFLCEFYTKYRNCTDHVEVLPLTGLGDIQRGDFDIAANIHSWSECSNRAIDFWLDKLVEWDVPYLFVTPHDERWVCVNEDGSIGSFRNNILARGWQEIAAQPKYKTGVQGLYPEVNYHLFWRALT
jgi:SAM-dependent methyltransferase